MGEEWKKTGNMSPILVNHELGEEIAHYEAFRGKKHF
jgi:hypothetical protein